MSSDSDEERDNRDERQELPPTLRAMTGHEPIEPGPDGSGRPEEATKAVEPAALRDAEAIAARVAADERAADAERDRLTAEPLPVIDAQADMLFQLEAGEHLHAERRAALIERGQEGQPFGGKLYLTSHRLVHIGTEAVEEVRLDAIADMAVALERLLLIELADGSDLAIEVDGPRLLRVQVAAARAALRERGG
jgi:hypothetical protein